MANEAEVMNAVMKAVDETFNGGGAGKPVKDRQVGIVIIAFPFGNAQSGKCNFISNGADRKDMAVLFREMAAKMEGQAEVTSGRIH